MFQTCSNSLLCTDSQYSSQSLTIGASLKHKNTQPLYIFGRENPQNSEPKNGPRSGLDYIALPAWNAKVLTTRPSRDWCKKKQIRSKCLRDHSSIMSSKRWVGGVRNWKFFFFFSTVNHQRGEWVGLKKSKTWWRNTWMVPYEIKPHISPILHSSRLRWSILGIRAYLLL